ncbi:AraC-like DNA-binding protein [Chitinophaga niastensis]|uniref:AraC-like DNA-binding protein n=1 Tax=Chitinophaga niastensis TaxID=536980 RepID=A0A2P8HH96_CHINA|nr:helix-turn-helix domain-containing protein [Chitinophaga niastensis]PSL45587.1 AraC-like DNA-binding protein [Chitinophaga niastensis]
MFFVVGIILAFFLDLLLISKKGKTLADKVLAFWLCCIGIHLLFFYLTYFHGSFTERPWALGIEIPLPLLHGPFLYLYTAALTRQFPHKWKFMLLHFVPAIVSYLYLVRFYRLPDEQKIFVYLNKGRGFELFTMLNLFVIILSGITYIVWSAILLKKYHRSLFDQFSYTEKINLKWLQYLIYGITIIWLFVILNREELVFGAVVVFVIFIGYFGIKQVGIFTHTGYNYQDRNVQVYKHTVIPQQIAAVAIPAKEAPASEEGGDLTGILEDEVSADDHPDKKKYSKSGLTGAVAGNLHQELTQMMENKKLFSESELSLAELAKELHTHPNYLSQIINELEGKNFYEYINTLRIEEFKRLISNPDNHQFTLLSLAYECGFNSKSSFNRYFKKATGLSPSAYLRSLNMEEMPTGIKGIGV